MIQIKTTTETIESKGCLILAGKIAVNRIVLAIAMNAYNALRLLGQKSLDKKTHGKHKRKRLGKVIRDLICVAGKLVKHGGELVFKIYEKDPILPMFLW